MINRTAEKELKALSGQFKAVALIGPRQSGKTTLAKHVFRDKAYVSLENPDERQFALVDPRGFLSRFPDGAVLDEVQRTPEIFSYLQQILDEDKTPGKFILTGSNNFLLQESISQSLAGRIAYLILLPFSLSELQLDNLTDEKQYIFKGSYPPVYDQPVDPSKWYANYIQTYIERDVRQIKNINDLSTFDRVLRLLAGRTGQLLNLNNLSIEAGVDGKTIASWLGILESSFIIHRLLPFYKNFNKRIVKTAKLYFYDTGIACSLLGIKSVEQLLYHPLAGNLFENMIISELLKIKYNNAKSDNLFFWRNNTGNEVDIIIDSPNGLYPVEIKSGRTITTDFFKGLLYWQKISKQQSGSIIYTGDIYQKRSNGIKIIPWNKLNLLIN